MPNRSNDSHSSRDADLISLTALSVLTGLILLLGPLPPAPGAGDAPPRAIAVASDAPAPRVSGLRNVGVTVSDLDASIRFYTEVLDFELVRAIEVAGEPLERLEGLFPARARVATLRLGDETLELTEYLAPSGRPLPADRRSNDRIFQHVAIVVSDMDAAYARLRAHRVRHASSEPQSIPASNPIAGGIRAFYFLDPDGHALEVIRFPPGKGAARWQRRDRLFLGIDHSAIVVADTERALRLYRDALGLAVVGSSENFGVEQARLNAVEGAHLRITTLRPAGAGGVALDALGIELLEYLAPRDGRPAPVDARASDLWHWQITMTVDDPSAGTVEAVRAGAERLSDGVVEVDRADYGFRRAALLRDRDGHALRLVTNDESR